MQHPEVSMQHPPSIDAGTAKHAVAAEPWRVERIHDTLEQHSQCLQFGGGQIIGNVCLCRCSGTAKHMVPAEP